uniref:DNA-binding protein D-ETS-4 n=1 Tax=Haemonchus contortus TaxID=6289 RepID=A0A7I5E9P8_HAECO
MNDIGACDKTAYGWPSISPEGQPDDATVYTQVKSEFSLDDDMFDIDKHQQQSRADDVMFAKPKAVPTATSDAAAASLQTAFCKKPSMKANDTISFNGINDAVKTEAGEEIYGAFGTTPFVNTPATTNTTCVAAENSSVTCQNSNACVDAQQMDIYRDLILRHLIQDISTTCAKLGLPTDAQNWTQEHGSRWISEMCQQFSLTPPRQTYLSGRVLLSMTQKDFIALAPEGGDTLYAQLQLWKTAFESYHQQQQAGGQSNGGITAADNSMPKNNWMTAGGQTTMIGPEPMKNNVGRPDFVQQYHPTELHQQHYFNNGAIGNGVQDGHAFFGNGVLPSPSDSDRSSNASMHDMADDECIDLQSMLQMQQDGMRFCSQMNGMEMANTQTPPTEEQRPSPFPRHSGTVHLWHFIRELLDHPNKQYGSCVRWVDRDEGTFKIESSHHLARFWGQRKNRAQMNYDKLSRSLRQYYKKGIIQKPEKKQRLVYKFLPPYNL